MLCKTVSSSTYNKVPWLGHSEGLQSIRYWLMMYFTMKFCWSGDQEYITGTEATAFKVLRGMTCLENSAKPLSTVHWKKEKKTKQESCRIVNTAISQHYVWIVCWQRGRVLTSLVPRNELTGVMMCTGWIRRSFHSWLRMSVRSIIFCLLELNMLCSGG